MTLTPSANSKIRLLFHCFGLGCLGGAVFLQFLVFLDIFSRGYFLAVEQNMIVLCTEIVLTGFAMFYFFFIIKKVLKDRLKMS
jgi:hypothetical protein